jgi:hypothetical protein
LPLHECCDQSDRFLPAALSDVVMLDQIFHGFCVPKQQKPTYWMSALVAKLNKGEPFEIVGLLESSQEIHNVPALFLG